jgi:hypothetical protein
LADGISDPFPDLSVLPKNTPYLVQTATAATAGFILFSLCLAGLFLILFILSVLQGKLGGKLDAILDKPVMQRMTAWLGFLAFIIGKTTMRRRSRSLIVSFPQA